MTKIDKERIINMKKILLLIPLLTIFMFTGCYDYTDLKDRAFVGGVAIDKEGDEYVVTIQLLHAKKGGEVSGTATSKPSVYVGRGKTINSALSNTTTTAPKYPCYTHLQLIVIQEKIANEGIKDILDFFLRHYESRHQFNIIVSKEDSAGEILKVQTIMEEFPVFNILGSLKVAKVEHGIGNSLIFDELISLVLKEGVEPTLPSIKIIGDKKVAPNEENIKNIQPKAQLQVDTLGVFKKNKLIGWLDEEESLGYNLALGRLSSTIINFPCDDKKNYITMRLLKIKPSISIEVKNGIPKATIFLTNEARLSEIMCNIDIDKSLDQIEFMVNNEITRLIKKVVDTSQKTYNSDILGYGRKTYEEDLSFWKKNRKKWDDIFPNIETKIKVDTVFIRSGTLDKTLYDKGDNNDRKK